MKVSKKVIPYAVMTSLATAAVVAPGALAASETIPAGFYIEKDGEAVYYSVAEFANLDADRKYLYISSSESFVFVEMGTNYAATWADIQEKRSVTAALKPYTPGLIKEGNFKRADGTELSFQEPVLDEPTDVTTGEPTDVTTGEPTDVTTGEPTDELVTEIVIEEVNNITRDVVEITFKALSEDLEGVKIEVIDNNGNKREVKPLNLVVNETEGVFEFVTPLTADPVGVWTVEGIDYDADVAAKLNKINAATTELPFYNALVAAGIQNVKVENAPSYIAEKPADEFASLEEVQDFVNEVNADLLTQEEQQELIDNLVDLLDPATPSQVKVLNALKASWERVNPDFIGDYITDLKTTNAIDGSTTFDEVQEQIDDVNVSLVDALVTTAVASADRDYYNEALAAMKFVRADDTEDTTDTVKADLQEQLVELNLVIRVLEASTAAQFANAYNALVAYIDDETVIGEEVFYTALRQQYITFVDDTTATTASEIETAIVMANTKKRAELYNEIANISDAAGSETTTANVLKKLQNLAAYVPDTDDFDLSEVVNETSRLEAYRTALAALTAISDVEDFAGVASKANVDSAIHDVRDAINNENTLAVAAPLDAIENFDSTDDSTFDGTDPEAGLLKLLKDKELNLGNVVDANKAAYLAEEAAITTAAGVDRAALKDLISDLNEVQIVANAKTAAQARPALGYVAIEAEVLSFINLTSAQKTEVSALFINDSKWGSTKFTGVDRQVSGLEDYTALAHVATDLNVVSTTYSTILGNVNDADTDTIAEMRDALAGIEYKAFADLSAIRKLEVAEYFLDNFPTRVVGETTERVPFRTFAAIQEAIDTAIEATK